jgi:sec-independent protein translocase protein TatB
MFDMSWGEVMVIGAVALIVIGPKDLPKALRTVGQVTGKIRRLAAEFQGQFAEAMREAELDDVKRQIQGVNESVSSFNPMQTIRDELKGAVEAPVTAAEKSPGETVAEAAAQGRGEANPPLPTEPAIALPVPSVPPIADPAESVALAVEKSAVVAMPADTPAPPVEPVEKLNEKPE